MKTFLVALFCIIRCILYPGTKIVVSAGNLSQGAEILSKVEEFMNNSGNLRREIESLKATSQKPSCKFRNGSWIKVVAPNQGARSGRANMIVVDEFRMVPKEIIDSVLRKFMTAEREPGYLSKKEYSHLKERNKEIYMSSAWLKSHWSWDKVQAYFKAMTDGKNYFMCALPYQMAIKEGLLNPEQVLDEMSEADFSPISWSMEMDCLFFGESENAYFRYEDLEKNREVSKPLYENNLYQTIKDKKFYMPPKEIGEIRLLSLDIASMSSKKNKNDATAFVVIRLVPNDSKSRYTYVVSYIDSMEGGHSKTQALQARRLYEQFDCDYIVIDANGTGNGVFDYLVDNLYDSELDKQYDAFSCINDETMAAKCMVEGAEKRIYSIKATLDFNHDMNILLKDSFAQGKIKLLLNEYDAKEVLSEIKGYSDLMPELKAKLLMPYVQTSILVNELVNLEKVNRDDGKIKLKEPSGKRKDRYSALGYGIMIARQLEMDLRPRNNRRSINLKSICRIRKQRTI